jgi:lysozyme
MNRKAIFDAVRAARGSKPWTEGEVASLDKVLDDLSVPRADAPDGVRRINAAGLALIKRWEGCKLTAYKCPADVWTIGYGSTGPHVKPGMSITAAEAEALLKRDLDRFERGVAGMAGTMTDGQFSALVSLAFNVGLGALQGSTLLKLHKVGSYEDAAQQFGRWNKAGGRVLTGLTKRRAEEAALYRGQG